MALPKEIVENIKIKLIQGYYGKDGEKIYPNLKEIAELYDISYEALRKEAPSWNWKQKRSEYQNEVARKVAEKKNSENLSSEEAERIVVDDFKFNRTANKLRRAIEIELDEILAGKQVKSLAYALQNLGKALESAQKVSQEAAGENISRIQLETAQNVKLNITDPDFMEQELEFAKKLIDSKKRPSQ